VPAASSSPIDVLARHLGSVGEIPATNRRSLLEALDSVPDPRHKRGVRYRFVSILFVSICAVVAGARSFAAIAEWAADAVASTASALPDVRIAATRQCFL
jgi:DDE_Tnp_1-associated